MSLSCGCDSWDWEPEAGDWTYWYNDNLDFEKLGTLRAKRCCSCKKLITPQDLCIKYSRYRYPYSEVEAKIYNFDWEEFNSEPTIRIADHCHCEKCGEIWLNLHSLGFECLAPSENMQESLNEYHELSGFEKKGDG